MDNKIFTGPGNFNDNTKWDGSTLPSAGDNLAVTTGTCTHTANESNVYGTLAIDASITENISTYNFTVGVATISGTLSMGVSASTGLTTAGITQTAGGVINGVSGSKISTSGNVEIVASGIANATTLQWTITSNINFSNLDDSKYFYGFTINAGAICTITSARCNLTANSSEFLIINGTLHCPTGTRAIIGAASGKTITFGASSDITNAGIGYLEIYANPDLLISNSKASAFSLTLISVITAASSRGMISADFSNADFTCNGASSGSSAYYIRFTAGTFKCKNFIAAQTVATSVITIDALTNNTSFVISGNFSLAVASGSFVWSSGTGNVTLVGNSSTFNGTGNTFGDFIVNATAGQIKTYTGNNATFKTLTVSTGTWAIGTNSMTSTGAVIVNAILSMGATVASGLTGGSLTTGASSTMTLTATSLITVSGAVSIDAGTTWTTPATGYFTLTGNSSNFNLGGKSIAALVVACSVGQTKTYTGNNATVGILRAIQGTCALGTNNITSSGQTTISGGILNIGTSSGNGLTTAGFLCSSGSMVVVDGSILRNYGNYVGYNANWKTSGDGTYIQMGNGNHNPVVENANSCWYSLTINAGVTMTCTNTGNTFLGAGSLTNGTNDININGTLAIAGDRATLAGRNITVGVNGDIVGPGYLQFFDPVATPKTVYTNNRATAFTYAGTIRFPLNTSNTELQIPAWNFANADVYFNGGNMPAGNKRYIQAGTLSCKNFSIVYELANFSIDLATYNPSFVVSGNYDLSVGGGSWTYIRGTGTITFTGGSSTINPNGKIIEDVIFNTSGTKTIGASFTTTNFTITAGEVDFGNYKVICSGNVDISNSSTFTRHEEFELTGSGKVIDVNGVNRQFKTIDIQTGADYELQAGNMLATTLNVDGELTFDIATATNCVYNTISGSGTLHSKTGDVVTIYTYLNNFSGTLDNVIIEEIEPGSKKAKFGLTMSWNLNMRIS